VKNSENCQGLKPVLQKSVHFTKCTNSTKMSTTTFCDLIAELTNVIKTTSIDLIRKIDELKRSVENLSTGVKEVQLGSELTVSKLQQVETGMADMDLPGYTGAMIELAQNVNHVLHAMETTKSTDDSHPQCDTPQALLPTPKQPEPNDSSSTQHHKEVDKTRGVPGVLIITDMTLTSSHINYVENQLDLGKVTVVEVDPPWSWDSFEEMEYQLRHFLLFGIYIPRCQYYTSML
jgi:hypothetical protein